jgi:DNA-binding response OmpR family regulator
MIPELSGVEVCRALRTSPSFAEKTPVIMLTARSSGSDRAKGIEAGADEYLIKPFVMSELIGRVQDLLNE